jgi:hypothetical protein
VTDALLFLHLLSAAMVFAALALFTALVLGARLERGTVTLSRVLWNGGLVGAIVFGIALAIDVDGYEIWDAWILIAIGLWLVVGPIGERGPRAYLDRSDEGALPSTYAQTHWLATAIVLLMLADMIWKPWA